MRWAFAAKLKVYAPNLYRKTLPSVSKGVTTLLYCDWFVRWHCNLPEAILRWEAGVPGGVTPLPLALLSPMTLTSSLTETPWSSGGISLLMCWGTGLRWSGGLWEGELARRAGSPLNHFWKNEGFLPSAGDGVRRVTVMPSIVATVVVDEDEGEQSREDLWTVIRLWRGGGVGLVASPTDRECSRRLESFDALKTSKLATLESMTTSIPLWSKVGDEAEAALRRFSSRSASLSMYWTSVLLRAKDQASPSTVKQYFSTASYLIKIIRSR